MRRRIKKAIATALSSFMVLQLCTIAALAAPTGTRAFSEDSVSELLLEDAVFYSLPEMYSNVVSVEKTELEGSDLSDCIIASTDDNSPVECSATLSKIVYKDINAVKANDVDSKQAKLSTVYVLRGTTKTSDNSATSHGVTLTGYIQWVDNFGIGNQFLYAGGERSGSYSGNGTYNVQNHTIGLAHGSFDSSFFTFGSSDPQKNIGMTFRLRVSSKASNGRTVEMTVMTSSFD